MASTVPTEDSVADEMSGDGFVSPLLNQFIPNIVAAHPEWFDYARRLNRVTMTMWSKHPITTAGQLPMDREPLAVRLLARALSSFQGAMLMLERGMVIEAGTLARSNYETGFWLAYLRDHPMAAIKQFEIDEIYSAIGRHEGYQKLYANNPERIASVNAALTKLRASKNKTTVKKLGIEALAKAGDCGDFYTFYRVLCGTSAHASVRSTDYYLKVFPDKTLGHEFGPDLDGIPQQAAFNCHAMLLCALSFANITEATAAHSLHDLTVEFDQRSKAMPFGTLD